MAYNVDTRDQTDLKTGQVDCLAPEFAKPLSIKLIYRKQDGKLICSNPYRLSYGGKSRTFSNVLHVLHQKDHFNHLIKQLWF